EPAEHLVPACLGLDKVGMLVDVLLQPILIARQLEEVILFGEPLRFELGVDQAVSIVEVRVLLEGFAGDAVPTLIDTLVDIASGLQFGDEGLHPADMVGILGPDEAVITDAETGFDVAVELGHPGGELSSRYALYLRPPTDVVRVLIRPGQKEGLVADQAVVACQRIRPDQLVDEAQVRRGVRIDDGGGDVELTHEAFQSLPATTTVSSPRGGVFAKCSRSVAGVPRRNSSWTLVISRATTSERGPRAPGCRRRTPGRYRAARGGRESSAAGALRCGHGGSSEDGATQSGSGASRCGGYPRRRSGAPTRGHAGRAASCRPGCRSALPPGRGSP